MSPFQPYVTEGGERGRKRELRVAVVFLAVALIIMMLPDVYRESVARAVRGTVLRPVFAMQRGTVERQSRFVDAERLRAERDSLAAFLVGQATAAAENRQLRQLLDVRERMPRRFVAAEIVHLPGRGMEGAFLITKGRRDGVLPSAPLVSAAGLVGVVREVDEHAAIGIDWTHPDFAVSAMTLDGETYGIVRPRTSGRGEPLLALTGVAVHAQLEEGTLIVSSGRGGVFPRGIPIGKVVGSEEEAEDWRRTYLLRPMTGAAEFTHVLVLGEADEGATHRDFASIWGIRTGAERAPADTAAFTGGALPPEPGAPVAEAEQPPAPPPARPAGPQRERILGRPLPN